MCVPHIGSLIWNFTPIFGQQISILDPPYIRLFGLSWSELSPCGESGGGGINWAGDKLHCSVTEAHGCEQLAQGCYSTARWWASNSQPLSNKSNSLDAGLLSHPLLLYRVYIKNIQDRVMRYGDWWLRCHRRHQGITSHALQTIIKHTHLSISVKNCASVLLRCLSVPTLTREKPSMCMTPSKSRPRCCPADRDVCQLIRGETEVRYFSQQLKVDAPQTVTWLEQIKTYIMDLFTVETY